MNLSFPKKVVFALGVFCFLALNIALAADEEGKGKKSWRVAIDADAARQLREATELIRKKQWPIALRLLQKLIDDEDERVICLLEKGGKGNRYLIVRPECERLLASLPSAGRQEYERTFGPVAARLLEKARTKRSDESLSLIVERYLFTDAGLAALRESAERNAKAGNSHLAALDYARLLDHLGLARWTNDELYRAATIFGRLGQSHRAGVAFKHLTSRARENIIALAERNVPLEVLREEFAAGSSSVFRNGEWPLYRGDWSRSNRGFGQPPILEELWRQSMFREGSASKIAEAHLRTAQHEIQDLRELATIDQPFLVRSKRETRIPPNEFRSPIVSAFAPIAVTVRDAQGQKIPLIVYRDHRGAAAVDARNGRFTWWWQSDLCLQSIIEEFDNPLSNVAARWVSLNRSRNPRVFFNNSLSGTLSTDGQRVYAIEDFEVPPSPDVLGNTPVPRGASHPREIEIAINRNSLVALSLDRNSGKVIWTSSGNKKALENCHFLAPPLPIDGLLYVLVQKDLRVSLCCLDPSAHRMIGHQRIPEFKLIFNKPLVEVSASIVDDPLRRIHAAHLSYGNGILVCPIPSGVVLGVDLASRRLAWLYSYREKAEKEPVSPRPVMLLPNHWITTSPVVAGEKVVIAPSDDSAIHCLNLRDGTCLWSRKKELDDIYFAGVYGEKVLIVGTHRVRAISLNNGETQWTRDAGTPSGQGTAAGDVFYLPLQRGSLTYGPGILALDIETGEVRARHNVPPRRSGPEEFHVPGNLTFLHGMLISQSPWEIVAYRPLVSKIKEVEQHILRQPHDTAARIDRAELLRDAGKLTESIEQLHELLRERPEWLLRERAQAVLFDALTDSIERDPLKGAGALNELKELEDTVQREIPKYRLGVLQRLQRRYRLMLGLVREKQGRSLEAMQAYLDFAASQPRDELLPSPTEPALIESADVWVRARLASLRKTTTSTQRREMEESLNCRLRDVATSPDLRHLRDFLDRIGTETVAGREARLLFVERVLTRGESQRFLESELLLLPLAKQKADPVRAARALELLGRLSMAESQIPDAVYFYRRLQRDFGKKVITGGKTGDDFWKEVGDDKRFLPYLEQASPLFATRFKVRRESGDFRMPHPLLALKRQGDHLPFFTDHRIGLEITENYLTLQSILTRGQTWRTPIRPYSFRSLLPDSYVRNWPRFRYYTQGHLSIVPGGDRVYGVDLLARQMLWEVGTTLENQRPPNEAVVIDYATRHGTPRLRYPDGWLQLPGCNLVVSPSVACVATRSGLYGLDLLTGRLLWGRGDLPRNLSLFGDDDYVLAVEQSGTGEAISTHVLRLADGGSVDAPDFSASFDRRVQEHGRTLVVAHQDDRGEVTLLLYDPLKGVNVWERKYPQKSIVLHSEESNFTGVVERNGYVHIVDVETGKEVVSAKAAEADQRLRKVESIHLLTDEKRFYLACDSSEEVDLPKGKRREDASDYEDLGRGGVMVNGTLYAFDRKTGENIWHLPVAHQRLVLEQFRDLPFLFLTARYRIRDLEVIDRDRSWYVSTLCIDKRTGRVLYRENLKNSGSFHTIRIDPPSGNVEYIGDKEKITISPQR